MQEKAEVYRVYGCQNVVFTNIHTVYLGTFTVTYVSVGNFAVPSFSATEMGVPIISFYVFVTMNEGSEK